MSGIARIAAGTSRRTFLRTTVGSALAGAVASEWVNPAAVHAAGSDQLRVGLIGCGGRGTGAAMQALQADKNVVLTAMGDAFADRLQSSLASMKNQLPDKVKVTPETCFVGFDAYQKVIDSGVDVVILTSPPGFRPVHLKAAVDAGKHVFAEKPIAVDAPGVRSVLASAKLAKEKNLALVSGFCWRYCYPECETFQRIHDGAIGDITSIYCYYNAAGLWSRPRQPQWSEMEFQLRNWLYYSWLSGDHIVEQAVHTIDKMSWAMRDVPPLRAIGSGGRQSRVDPVYGHIFDHFAIVYEYANDVRGHFYCRQQDGTATGVRDHYTGAKGVCNMTSGSSHRIQGATSWSYEGQMNNMYQTEHDEMFASIRAGKPINDGLRMAQSTMIALMGRMAAYTGQVVTWEQAMNSKEDLTPAKLEWGDMPVAPVAMPGKTKGLFQK